MRLTGLLGDVLLVAGVTGYSLTLLHLIGRDVQRNRRLREFDGWRVVQRQRIARRARAGRRPCGAARRVHPRRIGA